MTENKIEVSKFEFDSAVRESFIVIEGKKGESFQNNLKAFEEDFFKSLEREDLSKEDLYFSRIYLSDASNQHNSFVDSYLYNELNSGVVSMIQQRPLKGANIMGLFYFIKNKKNSPEKKFYDEKTLIVKDDNYKYLWQVNLNDSDHLDSYDQTETIFGAYDQSLQNEDLTMMESAIRTWIYCRDIDNNYDGLVSARKKYFEKNGLVPETRYIASTGIEGCSSQVKNLVSMDTFSVGGLKPEQIMRIEALSHLGPTSDYGVTFERGTRVRYGDRSHLYISGTASINREGEVVNPENPKLQTIRAMDNIKALLKGQGAGLNDIAYYIVYVRNSNDHEIIEETFKDIILKDTPYIFVEGAVCRPEWLVEIEAVAIIEEKSSPYNNFFNG